MLKRAIRSAFRSKIRTARICGRQRGLRGCSKAIGRMFSPIILFFIRLAYRRNERLLSIPGCEIFVPLLLLLHVKVSGLILRRLTRLSRRRKNSPMGMGAVAALLRLGFTMRPILCIRCDTMRLIPMRRLLFLWRLRRRCLCDRFCPIIPRAGYMHIFSKIRISFP